jgi:hypothetical protein
MVKSLGTLLLVELDSGQACSADYLMDFFGCLLNEDTDLFNLIRQSCDNLPRCLRIDASRAPLVEHKSQCVRARLDGG